ncbi:MAG: hypothetical protein C0501_05510 [Isosphaera sp.]|nr:hypothetical protein [Isosphaera sp.]
MPDEYPSPSDGRVLRLSRGRKLVQDWLHFSRRSETVAVERAVSLPEVAAARLAADPRPGWFAVLLKAYALAALAVPDLRRSLLTFPRLRLYQHDGSTCQVTVEREVDGEPAVLTYPLHRPEAKPLPELHAELARLRTAPLDEVESFRRALRLVRYPRPVRRFVMWLGLYVRGWWRQKFFGTFTASNISRAGADPVLGYSMLTSFLLPAAVSADGATTLRVFFDHRVADGAVVARALAAMEDALRGPILAELRALAGPPVV